MREDIEPLLERLWSEYTRLMPAAEQIRERLAARGERVVIDHIGLRTLRHRKLGIDATARLFEKFGYTAQAEYDLPDSGIHARRYECDVPDAPQLLVSELVLAEFSHPLRDIIDSLVRQFDTASLRDDTFVLGGCPWNPVLHDSFERLRAESEHAAWFAAFGMRPAHFAIRVNELESFDSLAALNAWLRENGFRIDTEGGEIKGSAEALLEWSATPAEPCTVHFADTVAEVPGCHLEFVQRHPLPNGELFPELVVPERRER